MPLSTATFYEDHYEIGFAAEAGWRHMYPDSEDPPRWRYVSDIADMRISEICEKTGAEDYCIYLTGPEKTFRFDLAKTKPYKDTRVDKKPFHFEGLTVYLRDVLPSKVATGIEADDLLTLHHLDPSEETILVSRDKDLRQVPGLFYSWELGNQPSYGPVDIDPLGRLDLRAKPLKLTGTGFLFFASQVLTGDPVDTIPGLKGYGPRKAYELLKDIRTAEEATDVLVNEYRDDEYLLEQGRLCWMTRKLNPDGTPVLWEIGMVA